MSERSVKSRPVLAVLGIVLAVGVGAAILIARWPTPVPAPPPPDDGPAPVAVAPPIPAYSETALLNTGPEARYVGSSVCAGCHAANHKSYMLTAHSRAMADADPADEPPDGIFRHEATGRTYRVYRQDGKLRHEEVLRDENGREVARVDLPVRYRVGSGAFCRTYIVEVDGFLHESPITWYDTKQRWNLSPGYDAARHSGFERDIVVRCVVCHAGRVDGGGAVHSPVFYEKAIGCESCHGPGSVHRDFHRSKKLAAGEEDRTIVHPGRLSRELRESVCASCHLGSPANVHLRGRGPTDVRPGRPLSDYRIEYRFDADESQMTVVGHVEQMRQSACYKKSDMTCLTCHDPHAREKPKDTVAFFRQKCQDCHERQPCKADPAERVKKAPGDNCMTCHMPRSDTDVPHVAFTHHRIVRRPQPHPAALDRVPRLVAADDESRLAPADRERNLGLAYIEAATKPPYDRHAAVFWERAGGHLEAAYKAGLRDAETLAGLAEYSGSRDVYRAMALAREALDAKDLTPEVRARMLRLRAECAIATRNFEAAIPPLEDLVKLRRSADDWRLLGMCHLYLNEPQRGLAPLEKALAIRPYRPVNHMGLAEAYRLLGDVRKATEHRDKAKWLTDRKQD